MSSHHACQRRGSISRYHPNSAYGYPVRAPGLQQGHDL